jgi:hypothetical protein
VAHGLSNQKIAERLHLSQRTPEHHVSEMLATLEVEDRGQVAAASMPRRPPLPRTTRPQRPRSTSSPPYRSPSGRKR